MSKNYYLRKLSPSLISVYLAFVVVFAFADVSISSVQYIFGLLFVIIGVSVRSWAAGHLQKNEKLITSGPYQYVKNPLYVGTFFVVSGICLIAQGKSISSLNEIVPLLLLGFFLLFFCFLYVPYKKRKEYNRLEKLFPTEWPRYFKSVPDYFPSLKQYKSEGSWSFQAYLQNSEHWTLLAITAAIVSMHLNKYIFKLLTD